MTILLTVVDNAWGPSNVVAHNTGIQNGSSAAVVLTTGAGFATAPAALAAPRRAANVAGLAPYPGHAIAAVGIWDLHCIAKKTAKRVWN